MCGIVAVVGRKGAVRSVIEGLHRLEYRGYDSSGICFQDHLRIEIVKAVGGVANLKVRTHGEETLALGHTRWATHGGVTQANAHPHPDCKNQIAVVHNGIIENHLELRHELQERGHTFHSETDTEVLPHLLEEDATKPLLEALRGVLGRIRGSFSIAAIRSGEQRVVFAKNSTPLIVGIGKGVQFLASDPNALAGIAEEVVYVEDGEHGEITPNELRLFAKDGKPKTPTRAKIAWDAEESDKAGFPHYMQKEIFETPQVLNRVMSGRVRFGPPYLHLDVPEALLRNAKRIKLLGAGTSYHACLIGAGYLRELTGLPAQADLAPEYKDLEPKEESGTLIIAVSQSGETLDTLEAVKVAQRQGLPVLVLTNNPNSAMGRRADAVLPLNAGPEVSVAATKTFLAQVVTLLLLALRLARLRGRIGDDRLAWFAHRLKELPRFFAQLHADMDAVGAAGHYLAKFNTAFLLAKGQNLHAAQEGALKLKEIAYQHAEAYSAGELKHGPFALLTTTTPVVFLIPNTGAPDKILSNVMEVRARGSPVILITSGNVPNADKLSTYHVALPETPELFQPILFANALHVLSYEAAKQRGHEIDRPRNLAKSVTVE